jgi:hypothetical protein
MGEHDYLLSEEFITFSQKIATIHAAKKTRTEEFKVIYDKYKADIADFEAETKAVADEFEAWKSEKK